jgi:hypothetical protein
MLHRNLMPGIGLLLRVGLFAALLMPTGAFARIKPKQDTGCDAAAALAATQTGVPRDVLLAISRAETGRTVDGQFAPWPWTVNEAGAGSWYDSKAAAIAHVQDALALGATNIDIGCFQLNWRWHGGSFATLDQMFDPANNALYAAEFLLQLYREQGDWDAAIGMYHSRRAEAAAGYLAKVSDLRGATPDDQTYAMAGPAARTNRFPLLQGGSVYRAGSLVASDAGGAEGASPLFDKASIPLLR